jgi:hypothetical protein
VVRPVPSFNVTPAAARHSYREAFGSLTAASCAAAWRNANAPPVSGCAFHVYLVKLHQI